MYFVFIVLRPCALPFLLSRLFHWSKGTDVSCVLLLFDERIERRGARCWLLRMTTKVSSNHGLTNGPRDLFVSFGLIGKDFPSFERLLIEGRTPTKLTAGGYERVGRLARIGSTSVVANIVRGREERVVREPTVSIHAGQLLLDVTNAKGIGAREFILRLAGRAQVDVPESRSFLFVHQFLYKQRMNARHAEGDRRLPRISFVLV